MTTYSVLLPARGLSLMFALASLIPAQTPGKNESANPAAAPKAAGKTWKQPRTPQGKPDFSGYWSNSTVTPLERPAALADKEFVTEEDAKVLEQRGNRDPIGRPREDSQAAEREKAAVAGGGSGAGPGGVSDYNGLWYELGKKVLANNRTSIITDPPDGRIPPFTHEAALRIEADRKFAAAHPADGPENLDSITRCITWITSGPPMLPTFYNNNYQFVQTRDQLVIVSEMIHDARIIPLDGSGHSDVRQWIGDSRGHWEGDTLVVETTSFNGKRALLGGRATEESAPAANQGGGGGAGGGGRAATGRPDERMRVIERFRRTAPDVLLYNFTVDDPGTYTKPWSGEIPLRITEGPLYEYACHEGNYAMVDILSGAREEEKKTMPRN